MAETVGDLIRAHREARGLSQRELGLRVGKSQTGVNYWEKNKRNLTVLDLIDVAQALEVAAADLIPGGTVQPDPPSYALPLRPGHRQPQNIYAQIVGGGEDVIAAAFTPEAARWLIATANANHQPGVESSDEEMTALRQQIRDATVYRCPSCDHMARWTDGTDTVAGEDVDEFWCQACGSETPLTGMTVVTIDEVLAQLHIVQTASIGAHALLADAERTLTDLAPISLKTRAEQAEAEVIAVNNERCEAVNRAVEAEALVRELYDPTPCDHFDHHGQCQTHSLGNPCPDALAQAFLAALDSEEASP